MAWLSPPSPTPHQTQLEAVVRNSYSQLNNATPIHKPESLLQGAGPAKERSQWSASSKTYAAPLRRFIASCRRWRSTLPAEHVKCGATNQRRNTQSDHFGNVCDNKPSLLRHLGVDGKRRSAGCDQSKVAAPLSNGLVAQAKNSKMVVRSIRKHNDHLEACEQNVFNDGSVTYDVHELRCDGLQLQLVPVLFIMSPFAGKKGEQTFACGERACYNKVKAEPQCGFQGSART